MSRQLLLDQIADRKKIKMKILKDFSLKNYKDLNNKLFINMNIYIIILIEHLN